MAVVPPPTLEPMLDDPDDYRPASRFAAVVDPGGPDGRVDGLCLIAEEIAPRDRVPLHRHPVDEVVLVLSGTDEITLGDERIVAGAGSCVFIPAGVVHGQSNAGTEPLQIRAIFPGTSIEIEMLDRNPAPGTEGDPPAHVVYDGRTGEIRSV